jgi:type II secretory pathway component GspD/PulD (secretin)
MKKTVLASATMAAALFGGAFFLPVRAQDRADPLVRIVTMKFENANVRDALRQVAESMKMPIDIDPDVQGRVTLALTNVTNQEMLTSLARRVDANVTMRQGRLRVRLDSSGTREFPGPYSPGGIPTQDSATISVDANQADVRETLRTIFRQSAASYAISPEVQGKVSAALQNVTMDTALATVLRQVDATFMIEGGVYHIVRRDPSTRPGLPTGTWSSEPPVVAQDNKYLYLISSGKIVKIRKSDLKVEREGAIPLQWGNQTVPMPWGAPTSRFGGGL